MRTLTRLPVSFGPAILRRIPAGLPVEALTPARSAASARALNLALILTLILALIPGALAAQSVLGGMAGRIESRQIRDRGDDSTTRTGYMAGAFVDVQTPVAPLSILAEAFYAQRGGRFEAGRSDALLGEVQADVLGFTVAPSLHVGLGPVSAFAYGGPMIETPVRTRFTDDLSVAYRTPAGQVLAVTAGGGLAVRAGIWSVRVEARVVEELSAAFSGDAGDFRHRSTEFLVRVGRSVVR